MDLKGQLNKFLVGQELIDAMAVFPSYQKDLSDPSERLQALLDIYKIYIPSPGAIDIYNRLYLAILGSLEKKDTKPEIILLNDNFRVIKGLKRYGVIGGLESFKITGCAGVGKSSSVQRCIDLICGGKVLVQDDPHREIIPVLVVEAVADGSFKSLLYSILQQVDSQIGTNFFLLNKRVTTTVDMLLATVANVLINHVAVLIIDEIERVANESYKGAVLINYLTQLVNQSNMAIGFVGNESANQYFEAKEYMSRRAIGISLKKMEYGEYYYHFASTLFGYQYTNKKVQFNAEIARYLFKASNGIPALLVGLFVETQRYAISTGIEELSLGLFEKVFQENFSNMIPFLESQEAKHQPIKETIDLGSENRLVNKMPSLFQKASQNATGEPTGMIMVLKDVISVEYVKL